MHITNLIVNLIKETNVYGAQEVFKSNYQTRLADMQNDNNLVESAYEVI